MKIGTGLILSAVLSLASQAYAAPDSACLKKLEAEHSKLTELEMQRICAGQGPGSRGAVPAAPAQPVIKTYDVTKNKKV